MFRETSSHCQHKEGSCKMTLKLLQCRKMHRQRKDAVGSGCQSAMFLLGQAQHLISVPSWDIGSGSHCDPPQVLFCRLV